MILNFLVGTMLLLFQHNPHKNLNISCESCHKTGGWTIVSYNHNLTIFPLTGAHQSALCIQCHSIRDFSKSEIKCNSCHEDFHKRQMGSDCERCHQTTTWLNIDRKLVHARTQFPLLGKHLNLDCHACHSNSVQDKNFRFLDVTCLSCHQSDLANASPNHTVNGYSSLCEKCHNPNGWQKVNYDHPQRFKIYIGEHFMRWESCNSCHPNYNNFKITFCGNCHSFQNYEESKYYHD